MRRDLADVRLADCVFAPHYAAPLPRRLERSAQLAASAESGADVLAELGPGEPFELLEIAGGKAWGVAPDHGLAGYLDADALSQAA